MSTNITPKLSPDENMLSCRYIEIIDRQEIMDTGIPNIELKNQTGKDFRIEELRESDGWDIIKFNKNEEIHILLGKGHIITSIEEFNKKCSALFGFTLYTIL